MVERGSAALHGVETDLLYAPGSGSHGDRIYVVISGNPGLIDYYVPFINKLRGHLGDHARVFGVGLMGHSSKPHTVPGVYSLEEQIQHKMAFLDELVGAHPSLPLDLEPPQLAEGSGKGNGNNKKSGSTQPRIVLLGHSVGAFMSMQILRRRPDLPIERVVNMFPAFKDFPDCTPGHLRALMVPPLREAFGLVGYGLSWLPHGVRRAIVKKAAGLSDHAAHVTAGALSRPTIRNCLYLAKTEHETIREFDHGFMEEQHEKMIWVMGKEDKWAPLHHYEELKEKHPHAAVHLDENNIPHAFVIHHSEEMAQLIYSLLEQYDLH